ncbi:hypothetical protein ABK040_005735 [Willaertia magna]
MLSGRKISKLATPLGQLCKRQGFSSSQLRFYAEDKNTSSQEDGIWDFEPPNPVDADDLERKLNNRVGNQGEMKDDSVYSTVIEEDRRVAQQKRADLKRDNDNLIDQEEMNEEEFGSSSESGDNQLDEYIRQKAPTSL